MLSLSSSDQYIYTEGIANIFFLRIKQIYAIQDYAIVHWNDYI